VNDVIEDILVVLRELRKSLEEIAARAQYLKMNLNNASKILKSRGLLDLGDNDCTLVAVRLVELGELLEGVVADDVGVEDEEWGVVFAKNLLGQLQGTGGAEGFCLDGEFDADVVCLFVL